MASFPLTQEPTPQLERAGSSNDAAGQHKDAPTASDDSGSNNAQESFFELCPAAGFRETPGDGLTWKTDREIMQRTVLLGRPVVTAIAFRGLARRSVLSAGGWEKTRVCFPVDLCQAGLRRFQTLLGYRQKKRTDRAQLE